MTADRGPLFQRTAALILATHNLALATGFPLQLLHSHTLTAGRKRDPSCSFSDISLILFRRLLNQYVSSL